MRVVFVIFIWCFWSLAGVTFNSKAADTSVEKTPVYGVLEATPDLWKSERAAGLTAIVLEVSWQHCEPRPGVFDATYLDEVKQRLSAARAAGFRIVLSPGWQYPPDWIFGLPHSRYVNQYGDVFADPAPGMAGFNAVFNRAVRDRLEKYLDRLISELGTDFVALRLGGGWYNELNYPPNRYQGHLNCYWGFDELAQGRTDGLPPGMTACPVPGWIPGTPPVGGNDPRAGRFIDWYLAGLKNYHDWQITMARKVFRGPLAMLYPSWGIRPGQIAAAVADQLGGETSAETNGELPRGFDFARCIRGITDPNVIVYSTWVDARADDDSGNDPTRWAPVHYLASLAHENPLRLQVWGENTGRNDAAAMHFAFEQAHRYRLLGLMWAFQDDLYDGRHATLMQLAKEIASSPPEISPR